LINKKTDKTRKRSPPQNHRMMIIQLEADLMIIPKLKS